MTDKPPIARALPGRLEGKQPKGVDTYRVVGQDGKPLRNKEEKYVDGGGYRNKNLAVMRAEEINEFYAKNPKS
jgi:hypothetical protein